jgi:MFS family permease
MTREEKKVIFASSLGTVFEWYDFFAYGTLAAIIGKQFFSPTLSSGTQFLFALLTFSAGFFVRPFGALVFGRLGDLVGRKYTFLITILIMGGSTFLVGCLPTFASIGIASPILLISLRLLQGLALGGEYGGAATYVAEHAPAHRRGEYTSWIQTTATLGLLLSILVILGVRQGVGEEAFADLWWRAPFLLSIFLLAVSVWIRMSLSESPAFRRMKAEGRGSKSPLGESFGKWGNLKIVILALFGLTAGQACVWYAGQFYAMIFLGQVLKVAPMTTQLLIAAALVLGTPLFIVFGILSDKIGRKVIILGGCLLCALTYFWIFGQLTHYANPALEKALATSPVVLTADKDSCHFQFEFVTNPTTKPTYVSSCDVATAALTANSVSYTIQGVAPGTVAAIKIGDKTINSFEGGPLDFPAFKTQLAAFKTLLAGEVKAAGYPAKADPEQINYVAVIALLFLLMIYVAMVYGPIAAMLVEMFPTRIRYTSMSLPYHIGNGWLGGFLPPVAVAMAQFSGDIYFGLWYPIGFALMTLVVGALFVKERRNVDLHTVE